MTIGLRDSSPHQQICIDGIVFITYPPILKAPVIHAGDEKMAARRQYSMIEYSTGEYSMKG